MNRLFANTIIIVFNLGLLSGGCVSSEGSKSVTYEHGVGIVIQEKTPILPHGTGDLVLKVSGRSFHNLYSGGYVWIPEWGSILFVTHREGSVYKLHVFSFETKRDIAIETNTPLGSDMGRSKTDKLTCFVEKVEGDVAILIERGYKSTDIRYELDREKKSLRPLRRTAGGPPNGK